MYERFAPCPGLIDVVEHYWVVISPDPGSPLRAVLVPNGRATLQLCLGRPGTRFDAHEASALNANVLLPASADPFVLEQEGASHYVGVQFTPWGARQLWPGLSDQPVQIDELVDSPPLAALYADPFTALDRWLSQMKLSVPADFSVIRRCIELIDADPARVKVSDLSSTTFVSPSTIYRAFTCGIGLTPQRYTSIM